MQSRKVQIVMVAVLLLVAGKIRAADWHVDGTLPPGGNGGSWPTAFKYLQDALAMAQSGDLVLVAQGTYRPDESIAFPDGSGDRSASFALETNVRIFGGFENGDAFEDRDPDAHVTILSGDLDAGGNADSYHVVTSGSTVTNARLEGFIIRGGRADGPGFDDSGAGLSLEGQTQIRNCTIEANTATNLGGGAFVLNDAAFVRCVFTSNVATSGGGLFYSDGPPSVLRLTNCEFRSNVVTGVGGGMAAGLSPSQVIDTEMANCLFVGNTGAALGGGVYLSMYGTNTLTNCTFADHATGGALSAGSDLTLVNCVLWGNEPQQLYAPNACVSDSIIEGGCQVSCCGTGNKNADPLFADAATGNYRLLVTSPGIDQGDNAAVPPDAADVDQDGDTMEKTPDLDLKAQRLIDGIVDFGPYEFCASDVNSDGTVSVSDLTAAILAWGSCAPQTLCPEDVNRDGIVDVADLVEIIMHWGDCGVQSPPASFYECVERCGPTEPGCIVSCGEMFGLFD